MNRVTKLIEHTLDDEAEIKRLRAENDRLRAFAARLWDRVSYEGLNLEQMEELEKMATETLRPLSS